MASKPTKEPSKEAVIKAGKFTTDKNAVHQQKILDEVKEDISIKQDPNIAPGSSPSDIHPSDQF